MPRTAVGLFEKPSLVDDVIREIETLGFPRKEVRTVKESATFEITGVMSFPRLDFEVDLARELARIGATKAEAGTYVAGLKRGGALVLATGSDERVNAAADIMNQHGAVEVSEESGSEPQLPIVAAGNPKPARESSVTAGRIREPSGAAVMFVW